MQELPEGRLILELRKMTSECSFTEKINQQRILVLRSQVSHRQKTIHVLLPWTWIVSRQSKFIILISPDNTGVLMALMHPIKCNPSFSTVTVLTYGDW